jgi:hypothetical protein
MESGRPKSRRTAAAPRTVAPAEKKKRPCRRNLAGVEAEIGTFNETWTAFLVQRLVVFRR